jgi:S1-C subfamily serine protease
MSVLRQLSDELAALAARAAPAVVGLVHRRGQGSGVVLAGDGYILTNAHVALAARDVAVRVGGRVEARAELVGADERTDLAVVRADVGPVRSLALADERTLAVGQLVLAIGNPLGFERSMSLGIVSALYRDLPTPGGGLSGLIQTDAAINPGNSGGPLLDAEGGVVGINTAVLSYARGIGFAVPARTASWVAAVLIQKGEVKRPRIGVLARSEEAKEPARAVRILGVEKDAPAERAGLAKGDLLLRANGEPTATLDDLQRALALSVGPELLLEVLRGDEVRALLVRPEAASAA